jgi:4'-phosphopantetheinyl transferase
MPTRPPPEALIMEMVAINRAAPGIATLALLDLDLPRAELDEYCCWLDADELQRAARFRRSIDRDRFVARRGLMRAHLGQELGIAPQMVRIATDACGKPFLRDDPDLAFNLSHSNGLALLATTRGGMIGCDIEWRNPELACPRVAERLFAAEEYETLTALPLEQWIAGFYNCWTRKEAYVKALGLGLSYPLDAFTVSVAPGEPARFTSDEPGWTLASFEPAPGYQAALVTWAGPSPAR